MDRPISSEDRRSAQRRVGAVAVTAFAALLLIGGVHRSAQADTAAPASAPASAPTVSPSTADPVLPQVPGEDHDGFRGGGGGDGDGFHGGGHFHGGGGDGGFGGGQTVPAPSAPAPSTGGSDGGAQT